MDNMVLIKFIKSLESVNMGNEMYVNFKKDDIYFLSYYKADVLIQK